MLPSPTVEPTKLPTPETRKAFDCGILSPKACASGDYVEWRDKSSGMAFEIKAGETITIPEDLVVAGKEQNEFGEFHIAAPRKDGSEQYEFYGDITPVDIGRTGKALPAGTVVGKIAGSGVRLFGGSDYNLVITFLTNEQLKKSFPEQTKNSPITMSSTPGRPGPPRPGFVFFDVAPPKSPRYLDVSFCKFITDPELCLKGQPVTREGFDDQIIGIDYTLPPGTPIYTLAGEFSPAWDNATGKVVGVHVTLPDGTSLSITNLEDRSDLVIEDPRVRQVKTGEVVARVGKTGTVSFSIGADLDPKTGKYIVSQSFFKQNFPAQVIEKPKKLRVVASGDPKVLITKSFRNDEPR